MDKVRAAAVAVLATFLLLSIGAAPAEARGMKPQADQSALLRQLGVRSFDGIVIDSAMTYDQALGDGVVPEQERAVHAAMKPHLRVVPVAYWGLGTNRHPDNRIHIGQIVVPRVACG